MKIPGYVRADGKVGIRNHVIVLSTVHCSAAVAEKIAAPVNAIPITHFYGCLQQPDDQAMTRRILLGMANQPNVAGVLVVGLGCEHLHSEALAADVKGKPVRWFDVQDAGGTTPSVQKGVELAAELIQEASRMTRQEVDLSALTLGLKCGGSDANSGLAANPVLGAATDRWIAAGGSALQGEIGPGIDHIIGRRAANEDVRRQLYAHLDRGWAKTKASGLSLGELNPTPGNVEGGLTTLVEKAIGGLMKGGHSPVQGMLERGEAPHGQGLWFAEGSGPTDIFHISDMSAAGAQIIGFTSGRGSPVGSAVTPVLKITGTNRTFCGMRDNIDFDASTVLFGEETLDQAGQRLFDEMIAVANGKLTRNEVLGHREFAIAHIGAKLSS